MINMVDMSNYYNQKLIFKSGMNVEFNYSFKVIEKLKDSSQTEDKVEIKSNNKEDDWKINKC